MVERDHKTCEEKSKMSKDSKKDEKERKPVFFSMEKAERYKRLMRGEKEKDERRYVRV